MKREHVTSQVENRPSTPVPDGGFPFNESFPYYSAGQYLHDQFGKRLFRVTVDAGFSCPNRDGTSGYDGCCFCTVDGFRPFASRPDKSITDQIGAFLPDCRRRHPKAEGFLVYFQPFTNTYGPAERLAESIDEALRFKEAAGIIIATRPDCLSEPIMTLLAETASRTWLQVELGVQSTTESTLLAMSRGHSWDQSRQALTLLKGRGIRVSAHMLLATPWEKRDAQITGAKILSELEIDAVKLHQLQILVGSPLAEREPPGGWKLPDLDEYAALVADFLAHLDRRIVVDRLMSASPRRLLIAPRWGVTPREVRERIIEEMNQRSLQQGCRTE
jgi:uncharacterized protein